MATCALLPWGRSTLPAMATPWIRVLTLAVIAPIAAAALVSPAAQANATPRPGKPCATLGAEVVQGRWVFTCTLKKGKKVWVRTPKPLPTPTWQQVVETLAANANARRADPPSTVFEFRASPSVAQSTVSSVRTSVAWSYETWHTVAPLEAFPVLITDERSEQWYMGESSTFAEDNCARHWWAKTNPSPQSISGAVCWGPNHEWGYKVLLLGSQAGQRAPWLYIHESVHVAQWSLLGNRAMNRMECWLGEGMAELYTGALSFIRPDGRIDNFSMSTYRRMAIANLRQIAPSSSQVGSATYWFEVIQASEDRSSETCWGKGLGYSLGYLVTEKLIADFGEARLFEWMRLTRETQDSHAAFADAFGIAQDTWYEQSAAPYVAQEASMILR